MDLLLTAVWGDGERRVIDTTDQLDALLDEVAAAARHDGRPQDVQLEAGEAGALGIVVGHERSVLNLFPLTETRLT